MSPRVAHRSLLSTRSLVLNRSYLPVHVTTVRHAFTLLYKGVAKAVDEEYQTFDFPDWSGLKVNGYDGIGTVSDSIRIPRVILLTRFDRIPRRDVRFSRHNIFLRDSNTCQYCRDRLPASGLNLDHVVPRSQGGLTTWENVVTCCLGCNHHKGGRRPEQANMRLHRKPVRPSWTPFIARGAGDSLYDEWRPFLHGGERAP